MSTPGVTLDVYFEQVLWKIPNVQTPGSPIRSIFPEQHCPEGLPMTREMLPVGTVHQQHGRPRKPGQGRNWTVMVLHCRYS